MIAFDHLRLVNRDPRELARFRGYLLGLSAGDVQDVQVLHEADDSCCAREPWNLTAAALVLAVGPPTRIAMVNL
jgi:hypothetical protein